MRWLLAWILYILGDLVYRIFAKRWRGYTVYSKLLIWSHEVQGPSGNGPWGPEFGPPSLVTYKSPYTLNNNINKTRDTCKDD